MVLRTVNETRAGSKLWWRAGREGSTAPALGASFTAQPGAVLAGWHSQLCAGTRPARGTESPSGSSSTPSQAAAAPSESAASCRGWGARGCGAAGSAPAGCEAPPASFLSAAKRGARAAKSFLPALQDASRAAGVRKRPCGRLLADPPPPRCAKIPFFWGALSRAVSRFGCGLWFLTGGAKGNEGGGLCSALLSAARGAIR